MKDSSGVPLRNLPGLLEEFPLEILPEVPFEDSPGVSLEATSRVFFS